MSITSTRNERPASIALLATLAAVLAVLAISLGRGSFEWSVDLLVVIATVAVATAVGALRPVLVQQPVLAVPLLE